jgi:transmembrane sensor
MAMKEHEDSMVQAVSDQAAEWFIRLKDRDLNPAERRKFVRWLKYSPGHIAEFMRLCQLYGRVKRAKVPALLPQELETNVVPVAFRDPGHTRPSAQPTMDLFDSRRLRFAFVACSLALLALVGVITSFALSSNTIETYVGEWRKVQLADGSQVNAGPNTLLHVDFSRKLRRIYLQRGEAIFAVEKDPSRPFIVNAGEAGVRAVGTRFGVDRRADRVSVVVAEGKVAVVGGDQIAQLEQAVNLNLAIALVRDESLVIPLNLPSVSLHTLHKERIDSSKALAWASGQFIFQQESLAAAVREFNRRNRIQIQVEHPDLAEFHVCCVFDASDPELFAETVASSLDDAVVVRDGPNKLRIVTRTAGQSVAPAPNDAI